jgi:hypothetical protein
MPRFRTACALAIFVLIAISAEAQWLNHPTAGIPRLPNGKPNLSAPAPRTQGNQTFPESGERIFGHRSYVALRFPFKPGQSPFTVNVEPSTGATGPPHDVFPAASRRPWWCQNFRSRLSRHQAWC